MPGSSVSVGRIVLASTVAGSSLRGTCTDPNCTIGPSWPGNTVQAGVNNPLAVTVCPPIVHVMEPPTGKPTLKYCVPGAKDVGWLAPRGAGVIELDVPSGTTIVEVV